MEISFVSDVTAIRSNIANVLLGERGKIELAAVLHSGPEKADVQHSHTPNGQVFRLLLLLRIGACSPSSDAGPLERTRVTTLKQDSYYYLTRCAEYFPTEGGTCGSRTSPSSEKKKMAAGTLSGGSTSARSESTTNEANGSQTDKQGISQDAPSSYLLSLLSAAAAWARKASTEKRRVVILSQRPSGWHS